jgi:hypothetical protein
LLAIRVHHARTPVTLQVISAGCQAILTHVSTARRRNPPRPCVRLAAAVRTGYNRYSSIRRGLRRGDGRHVRGPRPNLLFAVVFLVSAAG